MRERRGGNGKFIEEITVADQFEEKQLWRINAKLITELRAFIYFGEGKRGKGRNSLQHSLRYVEGSCNTTSFYVTDVPRKIELKQLSPCLFIFSLIKLYNQVIVNHHYLHLN